MLLAVRTSSYGCTWEVWRALKKLELLSAAPRATLTLLSCSPNFPRASITRCTHAKHEPIVNRLVGNFNFVFITGILMFSLVSLLNQRTAELKLFDIPCPNLGEKRKTRLTRGQN